MINESYQVEKFDFLNAGKVSSNIKNILKSLNLDSKIQRKVSVASYEAEINMIIHSDGGEINFQIDENYNLIIEYKDRGPGIKDIDLAITPGYSTASQKARDFGFGAGMGLINIIRNADEYSLSSSSSGTTLVLKFNLNA